MIKENKEKQREKNGNASTLKSDVVGTQISHSSESVAKEESSTDLNLSESDEGESSCKKNGLRVSGSATPVGTTNICTHTDHKPGILTTASVSTVPGGSNRTSSQGSGEMCLPDSTEGVKAEEPSLAENQASCTTVVKTEVNGNSNHEFPNSAGAGTTSNADTCESVLPLGIPLPTTTGPPPSGVQPLPSNVINKQPGTMEAQYMQQQSQIFVFSTNLANKSAEAVLQGQFPSIIAYHCAQPGTKKYLEKHPLKMNQFNRQNPAQWLNSLAQMKQKGGPGIMKGLPGGFQGASMVGEMATNAGSGSGMGVWNQTNNGSNNPSSTGANASSNNSNSCSNNVLSNISPATTCGNPLMQPCSSSIIPGCSASSLTGPIKTPVIDSPCLMSASPNTNSILPSMGTHSPSVPASSTPLLPGGSEMAGSPVMNHSNLAQPSLTGVKVPDENLTPQQRQHREEQLATLRKMQQMLFPEHHSPIPEGSGLPQPSEGLVMHGLGPVVNMGTAPGTAGTGSGSASGSVSASVAGPGGGSGAVPVSVSGAGTGTGPGVETGTGIAHGSGNGSVTGSGSGSGTGSVPGGPGPPESGVVPGPTSGSGATAGPASVAGGGPSGSNTSVIIAQKNLMPGCGSNPMTPTSAAAQMEWQKLQHQFYEERKKKASSNLVGGSSATGIGSPVVPSPPSSNGPGCTGNRVPIQSTGSQCVPGVTNVQGARAQGPPPPYHQTGRSASVPTALSSPNPSSPNNPTSNLSLPSPRAASGLNSPSDSSRSQFTLGGGNSNSATRLMGSGPSPTGVLNSSLDSPTASRPLHPSNPSTPGSTHLSPSASRKENLQNGSDFPAITPTASSQSTSTTVPNHQPSVDGMFCRTLQSLAQQKQQQQLNTSSKEPNLMPVPSPQQIQYLNTFEGQELTIQKQPNTSLKETSIQSPSVTPSCQDNLPQSGSDLASSRMSGPATPLTPSSTDFNSRCPPSNSDVNRFPIPSPHTPGSESRAQQSQQQNPQPVQTPQTQPQTSSQASQQSTQQLQQPLTPQQRERFPGPSPQSQGSRTPGMETTIKTPTTEVSAKYLSGGSPQMADNSTQPRYSNSSGSTSGTSPSLGNQNQNFIQQTPSSMGNMKVSSQFLDVSPSSAASTAVDVSPSSSGNFSCLRSENVPLNPNGNGGVSCSGKMTHFDPIVSMAQMSQQLTSSVANSPGSQTSTLMSSVPGSTCSSSMMPFSSSGIHSLSMNDIGSCSGLPESQSSGGLVNSIGGGPGNPSSTGNFVNIPMQTVPPHSYSPNSSVANIVPCSGTVNTTSCMNQPIAHPNTSGSPKPGNMMMGMVPARGSSPYSLSPVPQRMMGRPPGQSPYNGANVQVKASAPNTIQYLPAKPQSGSSGPRGPLSLDFLQRFANPLSNLDSKLPTHNLQYFPNSGQANPNVGGINVSLNRPNGLMTGMNSQIALSGHNCGIGGHGGPVNSLNGPMMGPNGPIVGMNLPMSSGLVMGPGGPGIGVVPLRGGIRPGGIMRMQQIGGLFGVPTNPGQSVGGDQMFGGGPTQNMSAGPNSQVFVPGSKTSPLGLGSAPDATQPLPPSMGQSNNFKNPPFIATSDPNYAQQFHNFQQQLYATNTRSQMTNQSGPNQSFFVPK